jgi:hypothetical protein
MFYLFAISPLNDILDLAILSLPSKSKKSIFVFQPFALRLLPLKQLPLLYIYEKMLLSLFFSSPMCTKNSAGLAV